MSVLLSRVACYSKINHCIDFRWGIMPNLCRLEGCFSIGLQTCIRWYRSISHAHQPHCSWNLLHSNFHPTWSTFLSLHSVHPWISPTKSLHYQNTIFHIHWLCIRKFGRHIWHQDGACILIDRLGDRSLLVQSLGDCWVWKWWHYFWFCFCRYEKCCWFCFGADVSLSCFWTELSLDWGNGLFLEFKRRLRVVLKHNYPFYF